MQQVGSRNMVASCTVALVMALLPASATAEQITFSGMVTYTGTYTADTLYVAVVDTAGEEDVTLLDLQATSIGAPPLNEAYSLEFDNTGVSAQLLVAAFLDVDGGGIDDINGPDVFGWYAGTSMPAAVSSSASQSGLDFALPLAEFRGTVTFGPGQFEARLNPRDDAECETEIFRPGHFMKSSGSYVVAGIYPGTYCVIAEGSFPTTEVDACHGDPTCETPTLVTVVGGEVISGLDIDFTSVTATEVHSWGRVKAIYHDRR